ncbi:MAG TPA: MarR family winged helix-turn-helix transcriptional regulator [Gaiellaceae bacterium]|nr:MarR family winged helix-turn-helix transcriptional regulator [Gaiellaceae bacterium]
MADTTDYASVAEFRAALRRFLRVSEEAARRHGLTPRRHLLLLMIKGAPGGDERSTVSELCERLQLAQSTVTELVQRAEDVGLVQREASGTDGRVAHLSLTPVGEGKLADLHRELSDERALLLEYLHPKPASASG